MLFLARRFHALAALFFSCFTLVIAHSTAPRPLKRIAHPTTHAIDILPRKHVHRRHHHHHHAAPAMPLESPTLLFSDSFRLTLSAFDDTFHLHLRPNDELVHPDAQVHYHTPQRDGTTAVRAVPLRREAVRAYWGEVVAPHATLDRLRQDAARVLRPTGAELGWARIVVHDQGDSARGRPPRFEGAFAVRGVVHHVMTRENYLRHRHALDPPPLVGRADPDGALVIWRDADALPDAAAHRDLRGASASSCAHDSLPYNTDPALNPVLRQQRRSDSWLNNPLAGLLVKRDDIAGSGMSTNFLNNIGQTQGCSTEQRVVYMGVAADCEYVQTYDTQEQATQQILNDWNTASALYKSTFNISLGIIELQVQSPTCPSQTNQSVPWNVACNATGVDLNARLSLFSAWRGLRAGDQAGLWHLVSGCPSGSEIGVAWLGTLCQQTADPQGNSSVSGAGVSTAGRTEWQVVAHEIGHNFGAIHDCASGCNSTSPCCPLSTSVCDANAQFIMSPVAESSELRFSQCTLGNICSLMETQTNTSCIVPPNPNLRTISLNQCGNGIVEPGEDCDPGPGMNSTCCNAQTCKFAPGAVCDYASSPCCSGQCQFAAAGTVCRPARDPTCDIAETCDGTAATCPADRFSNNGESCGANGLRCADGLCTSLNLQCQQSGSPLGLTTACGARDDTSCRVSCQNPNSTGCIVLDTMLVDGSPCGYGGSCQNGNCRSGSLLNTFAALYRENLQYSIPITVVVAALVLFVAYRLVLCCYDCSRRRKLGAPIRPGRRFASEPGHIRLGSETSLLAPAARTDSRSNNSSTPRPSPRPTLPSYSSITPAFPRSAASRPTAAPHERRVQGVSSSAGARSLPKRSGTGTGASPHPASLMPGGGRAVGRAPYSGWVDDRLYNGPRR